MLPSPRMQGNYATRVGVGVQLPLGKGLSTGSPNSQTCRINQIWGEKAASAGASGAPLQPLGIHKTEQQLGRFFWDSTKSRIWKLGPSGCHRALYFSSLEEEEAVGWAGSEQLHPPHSHSSGLLDAACTMWLGQGLGQGPGPTGFPDGATLPCTVLFLAQLLLGNGQKG